MHDFKTVSLLMGMFFLAGCSRQVDVADHDVRGLLAAIRTANTTPGPHVIRLAHRGLYVLSESAEPGLLLPTVRSDLVIEGDGSEIRGYSGEKLALLQVEKGSQLTLDKLSLAEGSDGAIRNFGTLHLNEVRVTDSTGSRISAIVLNHGRLDARNSEIAYNTISIAQRDAGTVLNYGDIELDGTSIHDNRASTKYPGQATAGGVLNFGSLRIDGLQLQDNDAEGAGDALDFPGILNVGNGVVEGKTDRGTVREATALADLGR